MEWNKLWQTLQEMRVPLLLIALARNLFTDSEATTIQNGSVSSALFKSAIGVRQKCICSPILFNMYSEHIMRDRLKGWRNSNLRFADDTAICATSWKKSKN